MSLLDITELSLSYGDKCLYKNAEFSLFKGEHVGIVGANGVGKSTFINICTGNTIPDEGTDQVAAGNQPWLPGSACRGGCAADRAGVYAGILFGAF